MRYRRRFSRRGKLTPRQLSMQREADQAEFRANTLRYGISESLRHTVDVEQVESLLSFGYLEMLPLLKKAEKLYNLIYNPPRARTVANPKPRTKAEKSAKTKSKR